MRHICLYIGVKIFSAYVRTGSPEVVQEALADLKMINDELNGHEEHWSLINLLHFSSAFYRYLSLASERETWRPLLEQVKKTTLLTIDP